MINRRRSGEIYHQQEVISPLTDEHGTITHFVAVITDVSEARSAEIALQRERNFFENVIDGLPGHFFLVNRHGRLLRWNDQVQESRGAPVPPRANLHDFFVPEQHGRIEQALIQAFETGTSSLECRLLQPTRGNVPFLLNLHCFQIEQVMYAAVTGTDISRQKSMEARLEELANTDRLTGLLNRGRLDQLLSLEVDRANRYRHSLSFVIFDIDHFKKINDQYGHRAGDDVLRGIARLATSISRHIDYFGRWGGEEFVLVAPETGIPGAVELAEKLRGQLQGRTFGPELRVTASFGVAEYRFDEPMQDLVIRADRALYQAKQSGRNRVCRG